MGGTTQKQFGIPNALEYEVVDTRTTNLRGSCTGLIRNKRTGQELWQHRLNFSDANQYKRYLEIAAWRRNRPFVASVQCLLEHTQSNLCGTVHTITIYLQLYPKSLSKMHLVGDSHQINLILNCFAGFLELFTRFGFFLVTDSMIWLDHEGTVRVWHNEDRSIAQPARRQADQGDQHQMIQGILFAVESHVKKSLITSLVELMQQKRITFQESLVVLRKANPCPQQSKDVSKLLQPEVATETKTTNPPINQVGYATVRRYANHVRTQAHPSQGAVSVSSTRKPTERSHSRRISELERIKGRQNNVVRVERSIEKVANRSQHHYNKQKTQLAHQSITFNYTNKPLSEAVGKPTRLLAPPIQRPPPSASLIRPALAEIQTNICQPADKPFGKVQHISTHSQEIDPDSEPPTEADSKDNLRPPEQLLFPNLQRMLSQKISITFKLSKSSVVDSVIGESNCNQQNFGANPTVGHIIQLDASMSESIVDANYPLKAEVQPYHPLIEIQSSQRQSEECDIVYYYGTNEIIELDPEIAADLLRISL